jgi:outer membrane protein
MNKVFYLILLLWLSDVTSVINSTSLTVHVKNSPPNGRVIFQLFNTKGSFSKLTSPQYNFVYPVSNSGVYYLPDTFPGSYALIVFWDENNNDKLDRTFIGIPKEPIAFSNNYTPKGPPQFDRAAFTVHASRNTPLLISFPLTRNKQRKWGIGLGHILSTTPYAGDDTIDYKIIPSIIYLGNRIQLLGPNIYVGITQKGPFRIKSLIQFRFGAYDESDSPILTGLGDRSHTIMGGPSVSVQLPKNGETILTYIHDLGNVHGGSIVSGKLKYTFQIGSVSIIPQFSINRMSGSLTHYEYGVPVGHSTTMRRSYSPGTAITLIPGIATRIIFKKQWSFSAQLRVLRLPPTISDSPIVSQSSPISSVAFLSYLF